MTPTRLNLCFNGPLSSFLLLAVTCIQSIPLHAAERGQELTAEHALNQVRLGAEFKPKITKPVFTGAFSVGVVLIDFPDTIQPSIAEIKRKSLHFGPLTIKEYFNEYSQGILWPEVTILGEAAFPKNVYRAPQILGYYCAYDYWVNPFGYKNPAEGGERAMLLKKAAEKFVTSKYKLPAGQPLDRRRKPHVINFIYANAHKPPAAVEALIAPGYKDRKHPWDDKKEIWEMYKPAIAWAEPLWPNSTPQVLASDDGGVLCHELGHVIGAPDYYHAPEKHDGVEGVPCLNWAFGPTGPGYCRYIYNAFLTKKNYPTINKNGRYQLSPRNTNPAGQRAVGAFIASAHPNYIYNIEYVQNEKAPLGNPGRGGLLVHVINLTLNSPFLGAPDLCYTYRPDDPWFRSTGSAASAFLGKATRRMKFDMTTNPSSRLPNLLDGGLSITVVSEKADGITFDLVINRKAVTGTALKDSLIPQVSLDMTSEILATSFRAHCNIMFRGEPMKTDYGFVCHTMPKPTIRHKLFPLYHRDRYDGRIGGLRPKTKYYVRAYARNARGVHYSKEELTITTLPSNTDITTVAPLLDDDFTANTELGAYYRQKLDSSKQGTIVGTTAQTAMLKLTSYHRRPLALSGSSSTLDYTRIHTKPTKSRPEFRMVELRSAWRECGQIVKSAGMTSNAFSKDFDKNFVKSFSLRKPRGSRNPLIQKLTPATTDAVAKQITDSLVRSIPVLVGQDSGYISPVEHGLCWVIIDGVKNGTQFHCIFPDKKDRKFSRRSGWYPLSTLLEEVDETRVFFELSAAH